MSLREMSSGRPDASARPRSPLRALLRIVSSCVLRWRPEGALVFRFRSGDTLTFGENPQGTAPVLTLTQLRVLARALRRGGIGFAESYIEGEIDCDDLVGLFLFFMANRERLQDTAFGQFRVRRADRRVHRSRANSLSGSARNISAHYDLGNDFYGLWLDPELNYSSGFYADGSEGLEAAQSAKSHMLLEALDLKPGMDVLDIGCGWGSLALKAWSEAGANVLGVTLSAQQLRHARRLAEARCAGEDCRFELMDYREVAGTYDRILSVEMIEAVGEENWPLYFQTLHDRLKPGGHAVLQAITIDERHFQRYRRNVDFIQHFIFPGGMLPTKQVIAAEAARAGLECAKQVEFGPSYARTLADWRERFERNWPRIAELGFDERFRRKWLYYLSYCEAGFLGQALDVGIYRLERPSS